MLTLKNKQTKKNFDEGKHIYGKRYVLMYVKSQGYQRAH